MTDTLSQFDKLPPHSIVAEQCLIASMMLDRELIGAVLAKLDRQAFYLADHAMIFRIISWLYRANRPVDAVLVREELAKRGQLDEVGGTAYLAEVLNTVPSAANGMHYADIVRDKHLLRELISASNDAIREAYAPHESVDDIVSRAEKRVTDLAHSNSGGTGVRHISEFADEFRDSVMSGENPRHLTGMYDLDQIIGGLTNGQMHVAAGRPAMGKSQFGKQIVRNLAMRGKACGIVTVEEQGRKIATNFTAGLSGIQNQRLAYRRFGPPEQSKSTAAEWETFLRAVTRLSELPIWISDEPTKLHEVERAIHTMIVKEKCEFVLVDYLQLIEAEGDSRQAMVNDISRGLKRMFKKHDVPGLVLAQLNRGTESREGNRPKMSDLRESGAIEQDADLILLLHREDYYRVQRGEIDQLDKTIDVIIAKNKDGAVGDVKMTFNGDTQTIEDHVPNFNH